MVSELLVVFFGVGGTVHIKIMFTYTVTVHVKRWDSILAKLVRGEKQWGQTMKLRSSTEIIFYCGK